MSSIRTLARRCAAALVSTSFAVGVATAQTTWYVDASNPPGGNGTSWVRAFHDFQLAIDAASAGDQVWVARGIYIPSVPTDPTDPRTSTFVLPPEISFYGGFQGDETSLAQRAGLFDQTILSGDLNPGAGSIFDNAYTVVTVPGTSPPPKSVVLDGFTVAHGYGLGSSLSPRRGGGIRISFAGHNATVVLRMTNCTVRDNISDQGGGIAVVNGGSLVMKKCIVRDNAAEDAGGGLFCLTGWVNSCNNEWCENVALNKGGAVHVNSTAPGMVRFANDLLHQNSADFGGAVYLAGGQFTSGIGTWKNCTFAYNMANNGVSIWANTTAQVPAGLHVHNSILWHGSGVLPEIVGPGADVRYCDVELGFPGVGNIAVDPQFVNPFAGNFRPGSGSPVNDAGCNSLVPPDFCDIDGDGNMTEQLPLDLDMTRRITDDPLAPDTGCPDNTQDTPIVDMGAYELG